MPKPVLAPTASKASPADAHDERGDWFATTLARGLSLVEAFGPDDLWLGNAELSRRTGLSKPTVSRLTSTLIELGYLTRNGDGKFRPGVRLLALAYGPSSFRVESRLKITGRRRARWACGQAAFEPVHMSTGRLPGERI